MLLGYFRFWGAGGRTPARTPKTGNNHLVHP
jgi:hypothetical protein